MDVLLAMSENSLMLIGASALCFIVLMTIAMRRRVGEKMGAPKFTSRERLEELTAHRGMRDDMQELLVELEELARKINAQIDTKFAKLEASIADADRRIVELRGLAGTRDAAASGKPARTSNGLNIVVDDAGAQATSDADAAPRDDVDDRRRRVYALADAGKSPLEIAEAVGQTPGEIELILSLRRNA
jgi:hypothetical protein